jgi:hypothetical protein
MNDQILCDGVTQGRTLCTRNGNNPIDGFNFCASHLRIYNRVRDVHGPRAPHKCHFITSTRRYCRFNREEGMLVCHHHQPHDPLGVGFVEPVAPLPPPPLPFELPFAADSQNVHRKEVSVQTNKATKFLMKIKLPKQKQNELWKVLAAGFLRFGTGDMGFYAGVIFDVSVWLKKTTCREPNDKLYRELLYRLIVYIQNSEHKDELFKRLWEECCDSLNMCCEGHISRLCNVLVGYVEGLDPPVSLGELTQQKMAAIAASDLTEEAKRQQANEFFDTHAVPAADRVAWLEAF